MTQELRDAAAALANGAAHAVCEPRRFHENEGDAQQTLGQAVARVRTALRETTGIPQASASVAIALASIAIHAEELMGPGGHESDATAIKGLLAQPGVRDYLDQLATLALLPIKRDDPVCPGCGRALSKPVVGDGACEEQWHK